MKNYSIFTWQKMKISSLKIILNSVFLILNLFCSSQNKIDSLLKLLRTDKEDTNKVNHLNALGGELKYNHMDSLRILSEKGLSLAENLKWEKGVASSYSNLGTYYYLKVDYRKSLDYYLKALKIDMTLNNKTETARCLGNIGNLYKDQVDNQQALNYYFMALKINEELGRKNGIVTNLNNIALVFGNQADYPKALEYYRKALKLAEEDGNNSSRVAILSNIGLIYKAQGFYPKALENYFSALKISEEIGNKSRIADLNGYIANVFDLQDDCPKALNYYFKALKIFKELGNKPGIATQIGKIGMVYSNQKDYSKALVTYSNALKLEEEIGNKNAISTNLGNIASVYLIKNDYSKALGLYLKALKIDEELGNKYGITTELGNIGLLYTHIGKYSEAYACLYRALGISDSIGVLNLVMSKYLMLSNLYEKSTIPLPDSIGGKMLNMEQMRLRSLYYYKRYVARRDTLFSEENKKQLVRNEMNYEFEKKELATKAEQDKKDALAAEELKIKEQQRNYFIIGFALVALLALFILRGYRQKQKANTIITEQKNLVDEKQKEILDSIRYAKRIQNALITSEKYIDKSLNKLTSL